METQTIRDFSMRGRCNRKRIRRARVSMDGLGLGVTAIGRALVAHSPALIEAIFGNSISHRPDPGAVRDGDRDQRDLAARQSSDDRAFPRYRRSWGSRPAICSSTRRRPLADVLVSAGMFATTSLYGWVRRRT